MNTERSNVAKVYSGKPGCMCGCNGNWTYTNDAPNDVGYEITRNERIVSRMYNKLKSFPADQIQVDEDANCEYVKTEDRMWVVYYR